MSRGGPMYRIFFIEDDRGIARAVAEQAAAWDLQVRAAEDFRNVMAEFAAFDPHLVLIDVSLPFYDGYHWCRQIRAVSRVPVIFLSSAGENMNVIMAMNMGADDFVVKPVDQSVLMAKIQALLRRTYDFGAAMPVLERQGAVLRTGDESLVYEGRRIELTKNEYRILLTLLQARGAVVSREKLMTVLWESEEFIDDNTLTVNVNRLRKKLAGAGLEDYIATKFGVGYQVK